jgi:predicted regulator of Ras-like GTPase activity (Roadblock/LC7/MglB family)
VELCHAGTIAGPNPRPVVDSQAMRTLDEILERLLDDAEGAVVAAVGGMDGLVVEQRPRERSELAVCVAELTSALVGVRRAVGGALGGGAIEELSVGSERVQALVRQVTPGHYLLLALEPTADRSAAARALSEGAREVRELLT